MKRSALHIFLLLFIFSFAVFPSNGQDPVTTLVDTTSADTTVTTPKTHSFWVWGGYGNSMTLASTLSKSQQFWFGSLIYGYREALYFSASSFHLDRTDPFLALNAFAVSYTHSFNSWLDFTTSLSRYQVAGRLDTVLFKSFFYGDITAGLDWKILYTQISAGTIFSEDNSMFFQLKNSRYFQTGAFFKDRVYASFDPNLNLLFGSLLRIKTSEGTTIGINSPIGTWGSDPEPGRVKPGNPGHGKPPDPPEIPEISEFFGLMELELALPVGINYGNLSFEVQPGYLLPFYNDPSTPNPKGFTILVSCLYRF